MTVFRLNPRLPNEWYVVARPRSFDTDEVLCKIMEAFWAKGFDRTSFCDLERATGLKKGSLFAAFGDKEAIFARALEKYQDQRCRDLKGLECSDTSPRSLLKSWLMSSFEDAASTKTRRGCFLVNSGIGLAPKNRRCKSILNAYRNQTEGLLRELFARGISRSEFSKALDIDSAVRYLLSIVTGVHALCRDNDSAPFTRAELEGVIELTLTGLKYSNLHKD